jgi:hypothetical protein
MIRRLLVLTAAATVALAACSGTPGGQPALTDPKDILTKSVTSLKDVKSFHLKADVTGNLKLDLSGTGNAGSLNLQGTTAEGDVDIANKKIHVNFAAPALLGVTGDIIVIGNDTYTKISLLGDKYTKSTTTGADNPAGAASDPQKVIDQVQQFLNTPGVAPTKQADEKCGDKDCYHVSLNITSDMLNSATGNALGSAAPDATGTVDVWVQKDDLRPAKVNVNVNAGDTGTVQVATTVTNYDQPVTINPPPDSEIEAPSPSAS